ncbi:MAG: bifunctional diguanylate cyclase/phosphohydrolase, partial [Paraclostridium sp.]
NYTIYYIYIISIISLVIIYFIWLSKNQYEEINKSVNPRDFIETLLLIVISTVVIVATGNENSPYKFLYIFIIIISTIQFSREYAMKISIICSIIICGVDILSIYAKEGIHSKAVLVSYFQTDIVIVSAFLVTSWILGMYVNIEKEHSDGLQALVNIDELTGLYNHRYFQESLEKWISDSDETSNPISLLFMDIDYFKNYNDINGHQAGDLLLSRIGEILKKDIRENDIVARYGGEEFAVILPNTNEKDALKVGERIRTNIENTYFLGQENQPNKNTTISIGVSSYPKRAKTKHQLLNTADDALYRAKSLNKNRVELYYSVLEEICEEIHIEQDTIDSLKTFISMINKKDRYTYGHTERVVIYLGWFADSLNLSNEDKLNLKLAAYLHDIGKIEISEDVLNKKEKLTDEEFEILRDHPILGEELVKNIEPFKELLPLIRNHHEKYDGTGYPDRLKGDNIPYLARMITIADSFDAMTSHRPYNTRKSHEDAIQELRRCSGTQFDPYLVEKFIEMLNKENSKKNI